MKNLIAKLPSWLIRRYYGWRLKSLRARNAQATTKQVFTEVYRSNAWNREQNATASGAGSCGLAADAYVTKVRQFITANRIHSVVDLGCGDFRIGQQLLMPDVRYTGVDIVDELVERHRSRFGNARVRFECLDIIADPLPDGDLCLVRQVLQHLSNAQIARILPRLRQYQHVLVTEHYPSPSIAVIPNRDKPHGGDVRVNDNSAVYLDQPPFSVPAELWLDVEPGHYLVRPGERIRTFYLRSSPS